MKPLALLLALAPVAALADPIGTMIEEEMKKQGIPGISVAVVQKGRLAYAQGFGVRDLETREPVTKETVFPIASLSKPFVAMAILGLVEKGKLRLDDPINKYLPKYHESWQHLTIRHLLNHTSGLPEFRTGELWRKYSETGTTPEVILEHIMSMPLEFPARERYKYSNTNYVALGIILVKVTGVPYEKYMEDWMFRPLGMTSTQVLTKKEHLPGMAKGYVGLPDRLRGMPMFEASMAAAGGNMASNVLDLAKWDSSLYTERLLRRSTLDLITTDERLADGKEVGYAMGWALGWVRKSRHITHEGRIEGYRSYFGRYAAHDLTVIILANHFDAKLVPLARRIAGYYVPELDFEHPIRDNDPSLTARFRSFYEAVVSGTPDPAILSDGMRAHLTPERIASLSTMLKALGELKSFELLAREVHGRSVKHRYLATHEKDGRHISITVNADGYISGLMIETR